MATHEALAKAMAVLGATLPTREVTPEMVTGYDLALEDMTDAQLSVAVKRAVAECRFFPAPAELRDFAGMPKASDEPTPDVEGLLKNIWGHADYDPQYGTNPPRVEKVRDVFGDAVAEAYGYVGPGRLFSSNETTWTIARRDFAEALRSAMLAHGERSLPALNAGARTLLAPPTPALPRGGAS
jgi:hypothetical protein